MEFVHFSIFIVCVYGAIRSAVKTRLLLCIIYKEAIKDLQDNKAHGLGTVVLNTKPRDGDIVHEIYEIYGSSGKEDEEPDFEIVSDIDDDDDDDDTATGSGHFDSSDGHVDVGFTVTDDINDDGEESSSENNDNG
ncbi:hypothetical protein BTUL_0065g00170 [Botrytis tulipae]|uniref:Uncharacterized protein n=1 Tax=Botrytis tulipae TaxID=87230 RepID=A0A4Z1EX09_9HELO|nr:hypothetical protein BTUL_0065g00170 [Botrytis tulipae]